MQDEYLKELIELTSDELDLTYSIIEKDYYVTKAIHAFANIETEYFRLIFQGGTCLAKAHGIIKRMSEDCDFRIETKPSALELSKQKLRNKLKEFRDEILVNLKEVGFIINETNIKVRDTGNFMRIFAPYNSIYLKDNTIRPDILLEFIAINTKTPTIDLSITTLIRNTLGKKINHHEKIVHCVSIEETAAEKWVALTRRIANISHRGYHPKDAQLIRHIYDLHSINEAKPLDNDFYSLIEQIVSEDQIRYKSHNVNYYQNPINEIEQAIQTLINDKIWQENWNKFIKNLVFDDKLTAYEIALETFVEKSKDILEVLKS